VAFSGHNPESARGAACGKVAPHITRIFLGQFDESIVALKLLGSRESMKRYLPFVIVIIVAAIAVGGGAMLYQAKRPHLLTIPESKALPGKGDTASMHIRGNPDAPVTLEEFGDFQCPPCGSISPFLDELVKEYDPKVRLIFRNYPLAAHKHAREAAIAAEAAGLQNHYWEMHDVLYREQSIWSKADNVSELFLAYAGTIGLDVDQFKKDIESEAPKKRIETDVERANSLGIKVTPTVFVNNQELKQEARTPDGLRGAINEALKGKEEKK
jgi:protein-disulfide isomerase